MIPRADRTGWGGRRGEAMVVRLNAPPQDGKANDALRRFLADEFGTRLADVVIERGAKQRNKIVRIDAPSRMPDTLV